MRLPEKGSFGYFDRKKKLTLTATIISFLIVAVIYATGIFIYHTNKSVFTVIAALSVLPAAKIFVSFLVIAGCRSLSIEQKNELCFLTEERYIKKILKDCPPVSVKMYTDFEQMKKGIQLQKWKNHNTDNINNNSNHTDTTGVQTKNRMEHIEETILIYTI